MKSLLEAMGAGSQAELPGLVRGVPVRFIGDGWWQVEGARRCWHTVTIRALFHRKRIQRDGALTYVLAGQPLTTKENTT